MFGSAPRFCLRWGDYASRLALAPQQGCYEDEATGKKQHATCHAGEIADARAGNDESDGGQDEQDPAKNFMRAWRHKIPRGLLIR